MNKPYKIAVIPGDGTGPEVIREGLKVLKAASEKFDFEYKEDPFDFGGARYLKTKNTITDRELSALKKFDAIYLGAIGHPDVKPGILEQGILLKLRFSLDQYINLRPVKLYNADFCPLKDKKPGEEITLQTNKTLYQIILSENPDNSSKGYLGIYVAPDSGIKKEFREKYGEFIPNALLWFFGLLFWLFFLNLGIGLFNLVPIGPVDGGRMLQLSLHGVLGKERGDAITKAVSLLFVMIILINIMFAFLR